MNREIHFIMTILLFACTSASSVTNQKARKRFPNGANAR